jgi:GNAT superfamily N-acetyltransferase
MTQAGPSASAHGLGDAPIESVRGDYVISTDRSRVDVAAVHAFLSATYWSPGIPEDVIRRGIAGAICFGIYHGREQVGFARVITDRATYAYLSDVYVLESHRGRGLATWMMEVIMAHPDLQGLRRFSLSTRDAHALYARFGFGPVANPDRQMEIMRRDIYVKAAEGKARGELTRS